MLVHFGQDVDAVDGDVILTGEGRLEGVHTFSTLQVPHLYNYVDRGGREREGEGEGEREGKKEERRIL